MRQLLGHSYHLRAHLVLLSGCGRSMLCAWPACRANPRAQLAPGHRKLGLRHARTAAASRDDLLKGVSPEHRDDVARAVELAQRAASQWTTLVTGAALNLRPPVHATPVEGSSH